MKKKITLSYVLSQFALLFLAVLVIYPLFFVLMTSVKSHLRFTHSNRRII